MVKKELKPSETFTVPCRFLLFGVDKSHTYHINRRTAGARYGRRRKAYGSRCYFRWTRRILYAAPNASQDTSAGPRAIVFIYRFYPTSGDAALTLVSPRTGGPAAPFPRKR